ncbi:hypothetical protein RRG08_004914 [Elysia crispata]|uniref:Secreted protein n=1 Tax=Elysia crispata TaxID=231223 RepID=A0AAE0ZJJ9_9GAST|nr:hypothetical protein RRG08_004914 [Elysia crispata]
MSLLFGSACVFTSLVASMSLLPTLTDFMSHWLAFALPPGVLNFQQPSLSYARGHYSDELHRRTKKHFNNYFVF